MAKLLKKNKKKRQQENSGIALEKTIYIYL